MDHRPPISRRNLLLGTAAAFGVPAVLAGCGGSEQPSPGSTSGNLGAVTLGSNASDEVPKKSLATVIEKFTQASVRINTVDHNTFQENINRYLRGTPDDVFTWFAGYRMQFFAEQGLATDISDVWQEIGGDYTQAFKDASTGVDGKQYFIPFTYYPWAVFYRKSVWEEKGYEPPKTLDELTALAKKMQGDDLVPIAFADKDGWPAMGTFDIINMRMNGYDFHISLMAGKESWTDPRVKQVFDTWRGLMEYHQPASLGRTWQEAAQSLVQKKSGMYLLGMFVAQQFPEEDLADLDFFTFPEINPTHGTDSIDAPPSTATWSPPRPRTSTGPRRSSSTSPRRRRRTSPPSWTPAPSRPAPRPTPAATARCRSAAPNWCRRPRTSPSSSTVTRGRTSPPR
ncbi:ABC transporter substrate-binding protein [Nonomuraea ferruginea]